MKTKAEIKEKAIKLINKLKKTEVQNTFTLYIDFYNEDIRITKYKPKEHYKYEILCTYEKNFYDETLDRIKYVLKEDLEFRLNNKINNKIFN